jgi:zinc/manganese transport system substrate-binding protein
MKIHLGISLVVATCLAVLLGVSCDRKRDLVRPQKKTIITTYAILETVVKDLVGDDFEVTSSVPNGFDIHGWEPSAKDIEALTKADLIVENGLSLESGMSNALEQARKSGVKIFTASNYIKIRRVGDGEGVCPTDPDQAPGAKDPHFWTDPISMKNMIDALAVQIREQFGIDLSTRAANLGKRLTDLDSEIRNKVSDLPPRKRKLITGHESLGYFAQRYGFKLIGAVIPSVTNEAESSASSLKRLKRLIVQNQMPTIFAETGTPPKTVEALARETGVRTITIATHNLPQNKSYFTFERELSDTIISGLK